VAIRSDDRAELIEERLRIYERDKRLPWRSCREGRVRIRRVAANAAAGQRIEPIVQIVSEA
jgi:hypothetical protein